MRERMETAQSLCAMAACNTAFEDCQESGEYDLGKKLLLFFIIQLTPS